MIKIGNTEITDVFLGSTQVNKVYQGSNLIWEKSAPVLPYDAEVEYLYSSGTSQYIDTDITYDSTVKIEMKVQLTGTATGNYIFGIYTVVNGTAQRWAVNCYSTTQVRPHFGTVTNYNVAFSRNTFHILSANYRTLTIDGTSKNSGAAAFTPENDVNIYLFCRSNRNTADTFRAVYIGYCKLWKNNVLVRDYIPVRKDSIGYMYDKVSGQLFGNAGGDSFTYGNDVT